MKYHFIFEVACIYGERKMAISDFSYEGEIVLDINDDNILNQYYRFIINNSKGKFKGFTMRMLSIIKDGVNIYSEDYINN